MNKKYLFTSGLVIILTVLAVGIFLKTRATPISEIKADSVNTETVVVTNETSKAFNSTSTDSEIIDETTRPVDQKQLAFSIAKKKEASLLSDKELKITFLSDAATLMQTPDIYLALKVGRYLNELDKRKISNNEIEEFRNSLLVKYHPCWGIPEGQCME